MKILPAVLLVQFQASGHHDIGPGFREILMPGEPEFREYARNAEAGTVDIAVETFREACRICERLCPETDPRKYVVEQA